MEYTLHNKLDLKYIRRKLRSEMPKSEVVLWSYLKGKQLGYKFRRQHSIGPYIVDFYCPAKRLVIEVDGETHLEQSQVTKDHQRDSYFHANYIRILRFLNTDIKENVRGVIESIGRVIGDIP
jgi:very-short-patch-repair endonuclease